MTTVKEGAGQLDLDHTSSSGAGMESALKQCRPDREWGKPFPKGRPKYGYQKNGTRCGQSRPKQGKSPACYN